ncbi:MAG: serine/threonine protein kinase [Deltaproteobacteria bacterium]|nr:serine/threonine protein kinase [Deltaproteobacteria bacterium]
MAGTEPLTIAITLPACLAVPPPIPKKLAHGSDPAIVLPVVDTSAKATRKIGKLSKPKVRPELHEGTRAGAWNVGPELGKGGMASVHAVTHCVFGKRAALKLAHAEILGPQFTCETFLREARIANLVDHPAVTDVFATGSFDNRPYLVMERLSGETLGARLDRGPLDRDEAIEILLELCDVLGAAHNAGVIHRDLKLDNVFLLDTPGRKLKLLDWGVASVVGEPDPLAGMVAGTLTYVAPEQLRGDELTPSADVYSLAVLAYQLLLGAPPFESPNDLELIRKHLHSAPPAPSTMWAEIPADLEALLLGMLAKRAEDRPVLDEVVQVLTQMRSVVVPVRAAKRRSLFPAFIPVRMLGAALGIAAAALSIAAMG